MDNHRRDPASQAHCRGQGYFEATRNEEAFELIRANPFAFILAYTIAARASWSEGFNRHGLDFGEAFLGDFKSYGMSERNYRTAKLHLAKWGFATFKATNKGTVGKLTDTRLFKINPRRSDGQPTDSRRTADGQPTTNLKLIKQEISKAYSTKGPTTKPTKANKLSMQQREIAIRIEQALGQQWRNDSGKWVNRCKVNSHKAERVIAECESAIREGRVNTTPAQYAEQIWKEFA